MEKIFCSPEGRREGKNGKAGHRKNPLLYVVQPPKREGEERARERESGGGNWNWEQGREGRKEQKNQSQDRKI